MAPFGFHWLTFGAVLVTAASVIASIIWALVVHPREDDDA